MRRAPVRVLSAACALCGAHAVQAQPARQWIRFDGANEASSGVDFTFSRPSEVYDSEGRLVAPDVPRYHAETLFCALPERETLVSGLAINAIAAGMSADGVAPLYVLNTATLKRLSIHIGQGSVERAFRDGDWNDCYTLSYKDVTKDNQANLLTGQTGANGGTVDAPNLAFELTNGGAVYNGLIVLGCDVHELSGSAWKSRRAGLAYTTVDRLGQPDPWIVAALGPATSELDATHGSPWSMSAFPVGEDELVVVWSDYRMSRKTGGIAFATRFLRTAGEWVASPTVQLDRSESPFYTEHWHGGGLIRHADGRESFVISTGDGIGDNRLIARTRPAGGGWAAPQPLPDTGIDDRSRIYPVTSDWTPPAVVWGGQGEGPSLRHNQAMAMIAADPACTELLAGTDETSAVVLRLAYDPDTLTPTWRTQYLPAATSWPGDGVLNFNMDGFPGGPYLGRIDASGASKWDQEERETRLLFSPDGEHWGQFLVAGTPGSRRAVLDGTNVYLGCLGTDPLGFRRIDTPEHRVARPIEISPSGDNLLSPAMAVPAERVAPGVFIAPIENAVGLPEGVPPPPCGMANVFLIDSSSVTGELGVWRPTNGASIREPDGAVLLRAWVYALLPDSPSDPFTTAQLAAEMYDDGKRHLDCWSGRLDFDAGAWTPLTLWSTWDNPDGGDWSPRAFLKAARAESDARFRCLVAWEGLYVNTPTAQGHGLPPGGSGSAEEALVEGLALGGEWTVLATAMLPEDQWDSRVGGEASDGSCTSSTYRPQLLALESADGSDAIRVLADPRGQGMVLAVDQGGGQREASTSGTNFWLRGSPVLFVLRSGKGAVTLDYTVAGSEPARLSLTDPVVPERVRLGPDPIWFHSVEAIPRALPDGAIERVLETMTLRCPADFDGNDLVDTRDVLAFLNAWTVHGADADFNGDGRVDTLDVLAFLNAFSSGC